MVLVLFLFLIRPMYDSSKLLKLILILAGDFNNEMSVIHLNNREVILSPLLVYCIHT